MTQPLTRPVTAAEGTTAATPGGTGDDADDGAVIEESRGAPERFAEIFDRHAPAIHTYLSRRIGRSIADDLTAETFLIAFRRRDRYDPARRDARPWLYGIATNLLHHHQRTEIRQYRALARTGVDAVTQPDEEGVVARLAAAGTTRQLAGALAALPAGQRHVLLLIAWAQFSQEEVAAALDVPLGTVRSRLHNARKRLRAALTDLEAAGHLGAKSS
jgi:RNA polymerase sigma factor (sigma-70 family)